MNMYKLIVDRESRIQEIVEVGEGGRYFDPFKVVWDERIHGPLSDALVSQLGGLIREGDQVSFDTNRKSQHDSAFAAQQSDSDSVSTRRTQRVALLKQVKSINTLAEAKAALVALVEHFGLDS